MIRPWIDDDIDPIAVRELSFAVHLGEFNEWWWFYPTLNSPFNNRAAVYNYKEGWWTSGRGVALGRHHVELHLRTRSSPTISRLPA